MASFPRSPRSSFTEYRGSQLLLLSAALLVLCSISVVSGQIQGVFLSLNGEIIPNDGYIIASAIGIANTGLHCNTDRSNCCRASDEGHWYRPDGSEVMNFTAEDNTRPEPDNFFSRDRVIGIVRLSRTGNPADRGRFCCDIPDASGDTVSLYVNIVDMLPTTTTPPPPTGPPTTTVSQSTPPTTTEQAMTTTTQSTPPITTQDLTGVFFSLNGVTIPNDSHVLVSSIGVGDSGLHCNTDRSDCCRDSDHPNAVAQGHWYRPDGSEVMSFTAEYAANPYQNFFSRDRVTGIVRLNRNRNAQDRGRFRCEIPNASGDTVTLYVNIVDMLLATTPPPPTEPATTTTQADIVNTTQANNTISPTTTSSDTPGTTVPPPVSVDVAPITFSGNNTAGEIYHLICSVSMTGSTDQPTITWLDPMNNQIMSTTGSISTLTFNPLEASDAGTYTCRATLGSAMDLASWTITVQDPTITVRIVPGENIPMVGSTYSLTCVVVGEERLTNNGAMVTYQWFKNGVVVPDQTVVTTSFNPLTFSDVGAYTCQATVTSSLLSTASITTSMANPVSIGLTLPAPTVSLMSDLTGSIVAVGSTVTLICTVQMHSSVRLSDLTILTVDTHLSMLGGESHALTGLTVTATTFTYTTQLNSFERSDSGNYTCTATARPRPEVSSYLTAASPVTTFLQLISDNIGVYLSLRGGIYVTNNSYIDIDDIGEGDNALLCVTDLTQCCRGSETSGRGTLGEWFYPNGTNVDIKDSGDDIYSNRGPSVVRLNCKNASSPTGQYCCMVPDATNSLQRVCANIVLEIPTTPEPASSTTPITGASCPSPAAPCICSSEVGIAVGALLLVEGIIAGVITIIVISCWFVMRRRKSGKSDFVVSANMAYGQVKLDTLGDVGGEYEDPDRLARSGQSGEGKYKPTGHPAPHEFPVSKSEAPVYATADETMTSGKNT